MKRDRVSSELSGGPERVPVINSFEGLVDALLGRDVGVDQLRVLVTQLHGAVAQGSLPAMKLVLDTAFGKERVIQSAEFARRVMKVVAKHLDKEAYEVCVDELRAELGSQFPNLDDSASA